MTPDLATMERELKNTRQEVRNLQVLQMRPGQSAEKLKHLADLERSARAEVKLRLRLRALVRQWDPNSRAAQLHDLAAKVQDARARVQTPAPAFPERQVPALSRDRTRRSAAPFAPKVGAKCGTHAPPSER